MLFVTLICYRDHQIILTLPISKQGVNDPIYIFVHILHGKIKIGFVCIQVKKPKISSVTANRHSNNIFQIKPMSLDMLETTGM